MIIVTVTPSLRFGSGLNKYSAGTDLWLARAGWNSAVDTLDAFFARADQGTSFNRGNPGIPRRVFYETDTKRLWWDTGTQWIEMSPVGGGGIPASAATVGTEGYSRIAARADHQHTPLVPVSAARMGHSGSQNANTGSWKVLDMTFTDFVEGSGMTAGPSGIQVTSAGQYQVSAKCILGGNPQGRRLMGLGTRSGRLVEQSISAVSASDMSMALSFEITVPAAGVIAPWVYQDSGLTLLVTVPQLTARRMS